MNKVREIENQEQIAPKVYVCVCCEYLKWTEKLSVKKKNFTQR